MIRSATILVGLCLTIGGTAIAQTASNGAVARTAFTSADTLQPQALYSRYDALAASSDKYTSYETLRDVAVWYYRTVSSRPELAAAIQADAESRYWPRMTVFLSQHEDPSPGISTVPQMRRDGMVVYLFTGRTTMQEEYDGLLNLCSYYQRH